MVSKFSTTFITVLIVCVGSLSLLGFLSQFSDVCEIACHFRLIYIVSLLILAVPVAVLRKEFLGISILLLLVINCIDVLPNYCPINQIPIPKGSTHVKIMEANLWGGKNSNKIAVLSSIQKFDPDILVFSEITKSWENYLDFELQAYRYRKVEPRFGGIGVYSKFALSNVQVQYFSNINRPRIKAIVECKKAKFLLIAMHTVIPKLFQKASCRRWTVGF